VDGKAEPAESRAAGVEGGLNCGQHIASVVVRVLRVQRRHIIIAVLAAFVAQKQNTKAAWKEHNAASRGSQYKKSQRLEPAITGAAKRGPDRELNPGPPRI